MKSDNETDFMLALDDVFGSKHQKAFYANTSVSFAGSSYSTC